MVSINSFSSTKTQQQNEQNLQHPKSPESAASSSSWQRLLSLPPKKRRASNSCCAGCQVWVSFVIYLLVGTSVCFGWNALVNSLASIRSLLYPTISTFSEPITASYNVSVVVGAAVLMLWGAKHLSILLVGLVGSGLSSLLFNCLSCYLTNITTAAWILSIPAVLLGLHVACALTSAFAFSSTSTANCTAISSGMGLAGLVTFVNWLCLSRVVFNLHGDASPSALTQLRYALMASTAVQGLIALLSAMAVAALLLSSSSHRSQASAVSSDGTAEGGTHENGDCCRHAASDDGPLPRHERIMSSSDSFLMTTADNTLKELTIKMEHNPLSRGEMLMESPIGGVKKPLPSSSWRSVCRSCFTIALCQFSTVAMSLYLFPNIWPLSWNQRSFVSDRLMGVFQLGDFVGRFFPLFCPPVTRKSLIMMTVSRALLVAVGYTLASTTMASQYRWIAIYLLNPWMEGLLLFLLATSNGFIATSSLVAATRSVESSLAKSRASTLCLVSLLAGVAFGNSLSVVNPLSFRQ